MLQPKLDHEHHYLKLAYHRHLKLLLGMPSWKYPALKFDGYMESVDIKILFSYAENTEFHAENAEFLGLDFGWDYSGMVSWVSRLSFFP